MSINLGKCPRCGEVLIAEQLKNHRCEISFKDVQDITIDHYYEMKSRDAQGHRTVIAVGVDGTLYRMRVCRHNPPHGATKRKFTGYEPNGNLTEPKTGLFCVRGTWPFQGFHRLRSGTCLGF